VLTTCLRSEFMPIFSNNYPDLIQLHAFLRAANPGGELGSGDRQSGIGYLFSGLAIAGVHAVSQSMPRGAPNRTH
jgi:hypothetical protein